MECRVAGHRVLEKGLEIDLRATWSQGGADAWEGTTTFFYRGRFGAPQAEARAPAPTLDGARTASRFRAPTWDRWSFGALTGDYNGVHQWDLYARRFGFRGAFAHPQRLAAMALAKLDRPRDPRASCESLELWIKGPIPYGAEVRLDVVDAVDPVDPVDAHGGLAFGVALEGDARHALLGRWRAEPT
jgi:acyl dehydratase